MVSDEEIVSGVQTLLRQVNFSDTTVPGIIQQLEAKLGLDLSEKRPFIRQQIEFFLRSPKHQFHFQQHQPSQPHPQTQPQQIQHHHPQIHSFPHHCDELQIAFGPKSADFECPPKAEVFVKNGGEISKDSTQSGSKRRGGPGGLTKVCGVSPELQVIVGQPALPRTQIVKELWAYIRKNNLQDPTNKRKIICNDALQLVFETDSTDMFKMNKLLAKHILPLDPTKNSGSEPKRLKATDLEGFTNLCTEAGPCPVIISDRLAKFFGTKESEMLPSEAAKRVWDYIKVNQLEDPLNSMEILCDSKLQELFGCENFSALGISEILALHFLKS